MAQARAQLVSGAASFPQRVSPRPRPKILVAEDHADSLEMMKTVLDLKGYQVLSAQNGIEALELALDKLPRSDSN